MDSIQKFLKEYDYIFTAISTIVSLATLVGVLQFKRKYRLVAEKSRFSKNKNSYVRELKSFISSIIKDRLYTEEFLTRIDAKLTELSVSYSFFSPILNLSIKYTLYNIRRKYKNEAINGNDEHLDKLRRQLQFILGRIEKVEEHI